MIVVIRYRTPFLINEMLSLLFYFALENYAILRSFLVLSSPLTMSTIVDLVTGELMCIELNNIFLLQRGLLSN